MELKLTLPFPPSLNHYKKVGRIVKTSSGKLFQQRVDTNETKTFYWRVYQEVKKLKLYQPNLYGGRTDLMFEVFIDMHPPHATASRRWDLDNRLKVLIDSLVKTKVIEDDSFIHRLVVEKKSPIEAGKVYVIIRELLIQRI